MAGSIAAGTPTAARSSGSQASVARSISMVRDAFVTSMTWMPPRTPPVSFQISQLSMVPNSRSPASAAARRSGPPASRIQATLRAEE